MPDVGVVLGSIALILGLFQYFPYIWDVLKNKTKPHAFSWFAWSLPTVVVFFAQIADNGGPGVWATGLTAFLCTVIFVLSLFKGEKDIRLLDWFSFIFSILGIALWFVTKNPLWAVGLTTAVDVVGFVPTVRKSILKPEEETRSTYFLGGLKWVFSVAALSNLSLVTLVYPIAMIFANWGFVALLAWRRMRYTKQNSSL